jgi:hypothetical protein
MIKIVVGLAQVKVLLSMKWANFVDQLYLFKVGILINGYEMFKIAETWEFLCLEQKI